MRRINYRSYLLITLLIVFACNNIDRVALGMVLQNIKADLHLSDTQLGFLGGISFALFYSVMGLPIARWADRGNRVAIIAVTAGLWSVAVALSGAAGNFTQLLLIRIGVAVGEAGCVPPALSLISDYFNRAERPRALAVYTLGPPLSFLIGFILTGWWNESYGWRMTFLLLALPGLLLSVVTWCTLVEPRRTKGGALSAPFAQLETMVTPGLQDSTWHVCVTLWNNTSFRDMLICISLIYFFGYGLLQWQPAFFIRSYGLNTGEVGTWLGITEGIAGIVGTVVGGELASRYAANNEPLQLKAMAWSLVSFGLFSTFIYISPNKYVAFGLNGLANLGLSLANGPLFSTVQTLVPSRMRATSIAVIYMFANFIGMGLGPLAVGALSDVVRQWEGEESLRYVLMISSPGYFWGAWHLWRASKTVLRDLPKCPDGDEVLVDINECGETGTYPGR